MGKDFRFQGYFCEAMSFLRFVTLAPDVTLEAATNIRQTAFHRISYADKHTISLALKTNTAMNERRAFNSLRNVVIIMVLSIQPILWNAVWRKFLPPSRMQKGSRTTTPEENSPGDDSHLTTPPQDDSPGGRLPRRTTPPEDDSPGGRLPAGQLPRRTTPPQDKCPVLSLLLLLPPGESSCGGDVLRGVVRWESSPGSYPPGELS